MEVNRNTQLHPLENPLILEKIFENSSLEDLLSCRLVSKLWCKETAKAMRNAASVTIKLDEDGEDMILFLKDIQREHSNFLRHPFVTEFKVQSNDMDDFYHRPVDYPIFWEFCGATICDLDLENVSFKTIESFMTAIVKCCPNLRYLRMYYCNIWGEERPQPSEWIPLQFQENRNLKELHMVRIRSNSLCWLELLSHFPSVQRISNSARKGFTIDRFFKSLSILRKHNPEDWNIKVLDFYFNDVQSPSEIAKFFKDRTIALENLIVKGFRLPQDSPAMQRILTSQSGSLQSLDMSRIEAPIPMMFPVSRALAFEKVKILKLGMFYATCDFLRNFPNVEKLVCWGYPDIAVKQSEFLIGFALEKCKKLSIIGSTWTIDALEIFASWFPNVKNLKFELGGTHNEIFECLLKKWPDLTSLRFRSKVVDECGFTGLDLEDVERINRDGKNSDWRPITVPRANISSFKHLKRFRWKWSSPSSSTQLGYCAAKYGIKQLESLEHLLVETHCQCVRDKRIWEDLHEKYKWN